MCYVFKVGDFKIAIDCHKVSLSNAKELGYKIGEGAAYSNLGNSFQSLGDFKQAIPHNHKLHLIQRLISGYSILPKIPISHHINYK